VWLEEKYVEGHFSEPSIPKAFNHEDDKCEVGSRTGKSPTFYGPRSKDEATN
jgi:hypothetical protein